MPGAPKPMPPLIQVAQKTQPAAPQVACADNEPSGEAQPDMQGRGSNESKQREDTRQAEKHGESIFVQTDDQGYGQEQTRRDDGHVEQTLDPGAGNRCGEVPTICASHGDHPGHFSQTHRQCDQPEPVPRGDLHGRAYAVAAVGHEVHANRVEQTLGHKQRYACPHQH